MPYILLNDASFFIDGIRSSSEKLEQIELSNARVASRAVFGDESETPAMSFRGTK